MTVASIITISSLSCPSRVSSIFYSYYFLLIFLVYCLCYPCPVYFCLLQLCIDFNKHVIIIICKCIFHAFRLCNLFLCSLIIFSISVFAIICYFMSYLFVHSSIAFQLRYFFIFLIILLHNTKI